ncbi:MFS multidrug transporter protein [Rutstroemia sp. NJR-2017a BVV2]|nr:MFS multidrug transporter protein [Rutstroemia sp. NJR-2017a BVV2]
MSLEKDPFVGYILLTLLSCFAMPDDSASRETLDIGNDDAAIAEPNVSETDALIPHSTLERQELSTRKLVLIFVNSTMVSTLVVPISGSFGSFKSLAWLGTSVAIPASYSWFIGILYVGVATAQPLVGRLTEIYSRRSGLLTTNALFLLGTIGCGVAPSLSFLIAARTVAGIGAGGIYACTTVIMSDLLTHRQRGLVSGCINLCYGVFMSLGGLFGGWINDVWGWRTTFLVQIPIIFIAIMGVYLFVDIPRQPRPVPSWRRIDFMGAASLVGFLAFMLVGLNVGGNILPWVYPLVLVTLPLSALSLALFILVESNPKLTPEPIIPLHLVREKTVLSVGITYFFTHVSAFTIAYFLPVYFQLLGYSTTQAGLRFTPTSISDGVSALVTGIFLRVTGKFLILNRVLHVLNIVGAVLFLNLSLYSKAWYYFLALVCAGAGFGGILNVNITSLVASVKREDQALAVSAAFVFRSAGSTLGVSLASTVFQNVLKKNLAIQLAGKIDADTIIRILRENFEVIWTLPGPTRELLHEGFMWSFLLAALASLGIEEKALSKTMEEPAPLQPPAA